MSFDELCQLRGESLALSNDNLTYAAVAETGLEQIHRAVMEHRDSPRMPLPRTLPPQIDQAPAGPPLSQSHGYVPGYAAPVVAPSVAGPGPVGPHDPGSGVRYRYQVT
jgi:hypothetical protein